MIVTRPPLSGALAVIPTLSPPPTNLWAWYEPSREVGLSNGDGIPTLTDQTGNGRHWTNASPPPGTGTQPIYDTTDALNGLAVAEMNGSHFWSGPDLTVLGSGLGNSKQSHVFLVIRSAFDSGALNGLWQLSTVTDGSLYPWTDGNIYDSGMKGIRDSYAPGVSLTSYRVYDIGQKASSGTGVHDGNWLVKLDGSTRFTQDEVGAFPNSTPTLGKNAGGDYCNVRIAGFYIYSADLTGTAERTAMINYINTRFGLSSS